MICEKLKRPTVKALIFRFANKNGCTTLEITKKCRQADIVKLRDECIKSIRHYGYSMPEIGRDFGPRHHTTILHSIKKTGATIGEAYK